MPMLDTPAVPLILDAMLGSQPVSLGLRFRQALRDVAENQGDPLALLRRSYQRLGYPGDDRVKRMELMLWPVAAMVTGFRCEREFPEASPKFSDFHIALEAMAVYSVHLLRDVVQFVESAHRGNMRALYQAEEVVKAVNAALATRPVEVLESLLEAAWKERSALPYASSRVLLSNTPEQFSWSAGHDVFTASARGLAWYRYGVIWLGQGHLCGGLPCLDYEERAALRARTGDVVDTTGAWQGRGKGAPQDVAPMRERTGGDPG
ncbi:hypothetical protein [Rhodanobacter sp. FW106-PBR-LB-2-11]|uniref:hypothetical protein n=1 Tax=Rhodanobacter sp. FW106-PBR-LB-2-11 TaxID=1524463 RepID=UPI0034E51E31